MELSALVFLVLALASYRITRFLVFDTLIATTRQRLYVRLTNATYDGWAIKRFLANKILEGISCTWCLGVWISAAVYWLYTWTSPEYWGRTGYITVAAIAGLQGLVHSFEPGDDE